MSEKLQYKPEQKSRDIDSIHLPVETVFHGTTVDTAKAILEEGFKPASHIRKPHSGPITWFATDSLISSGYGHETRERDANGMLTILPGRGGPDFTGPSYNAVIEAEIPESSDPRGFNNFENGIEYIGTARLVTERAIGNVAVKAVRLYEHRMRPDGRGRHAPQRLIDERTFGERPSLIKQIKDKIRREKNKMLGRPTL